MSNTDRLWINFGKSIAWGILFAIVISILELVLSVDVRVFEHKDFFSLLGAVTIFFGILGVLIGITVVYN